MIDFHSHILPELDDGASSTEISLQMLQASVGGGVTSIVATPHFYPTEDSVDAFLQAREVSVQKLLAAGAGTLPIHIYVGAEVAYFQGISHCERIKELCIGGTKYLLLEMPVFGWTDAVTQEVISLMYKQDVTVIIAHMDRNHCTEKQYTELLNMGVLIQINASALEGFFSKRKILKNIARQRVHFLGSDCHNITSRKSNIPFAEAIIQQRLGDAPIKELNKIGEWVLSGAKRIQ